MLLDELGPNKREAKDLVESCYDKICIALETGESVNLAGFGNFEKRDDVVAFHPSAKLKALTRDSR